uniref:Wiz C-terminal zinc finger domain-containing protein n=1 Tax=Oryzias sinensis TaxID=183150 RepID=A0A8C7WTW9_9TELE
MKSKQIQKSLHPNGKKITAFHISDFSLLVSQKPFSLSINLLKRNLQKRHDSFCYQQFLMLNKNLSQAIDCKAVRQRSRPGSKKKTPLLNQTPEEMYRLTCRFCDLVFQGPLSVQEDWIKHLQRHIMNTGVPHTGLGMVDVPPLITEPPILKTDEDSSLVVTNVAS